MKTVTFKKLNELMIDLLRSLGMTESNCRIISDLYLEISKRGVGHHDINNFPGRMETLLSGEVTVNPEFKLLSSYGCMESWDGDNGLGELINTFLMKRATSLAQDHGIGFCTVMNSNHYLASYPYTLQAAQLGYVGMIFAKGVPSMGMPGAQGNVVGQSPIGFAFPTRHSWPVILDICLAYTSGEQLLQKSKNDEPVPSWWGVGPDGQPAQSATELLKGVKYPIGEHKGFGLAILCELLTGVLSQGLILDQKADEDSIAWKSTSHTAIAIKADALMDMDAFITRSSELIDRIETRSPGIHIPGQHSYIQKKNCEQTGCLEISDDLFNRLNQYASQLNIELL